jgi:hypothetical protein
VHAKINEERRTVDVDVQRMWIFLRADNTEVSKSQMRS